MDVRCRQSDLQSQDAPIARGLRFLFHPRVREGVPMIIAPQAVSEKAESIRLKDYGIRFPGSEAPH